MSIAISIFKEASGYIIFNFIKTDGRSCTISPALLDNFGQNLFCEQYLTRNVQALFTSMQIFNQLVYLFNPSNVFA